jgi:hypothetical protein
MLARKLTKKLEGNIVDRVRQRMMKRASLRRRQWRSNRNSIAKVTGLSRQAIYRIKAYPVAAEAALASWPA